MKNEQSLRLSFAACVAVLALIIAPVFLSATAWADEDNDSVAGCQAVAVDPNMSMEGQQAICSAAEQVAGSSCAATGHGMCSSPKLNDTMVDGTNCLCVSESEEVAPV